MRKFYTIIFVAFLFLLKLNSFGNIFLNQKSSILSGDKELMLKKINSLILTEEVFINNQKNWIGWDYQSLFRLVLINKKFKGNLILNNETIKGKDISDVGYYQNLYGEEFYNCDVNIFEKIKELTKSKLIKEEIILTIPEYKELVKNPFIANIWSGYAEKVPFNDTAIDVLINEFGKNETSKIEGLIFFTQLGQKQKGQKVSKAIDLFKNEVLLIFNGYGKMVNDEIKIKALAILLYSGYNENIKDQIDFLSDYQAQRKGTFSDVNLIGNRVGFVYNESTNVYGYWALLQLREIVKSK